MEPVYEQLVRDVDVVQRSISTLADGDGAAVTQWSSDRLRTWSNQPWSQDGEQLPLVYHASAELRARFRDFAALSSWVGDHVASVEGFEVVTIGWSLTEKRRSKMAHEVRRGAVHDAVERAQLYADALGLGAVRPVAVADVGMLDAGGGSDGYRESGALEPLAAAPGRSRPDIELVPRNIEMSAAVDARFAVE